MKNNPLLRLHDFGQVVWLDYIHRHMIVSGELKRLIDEDGLRGVTSNPSIFEKAIVESHDYDEDVQSMALAGKRPEEIFECLSVKDVGDAADLFRSVHERSGGKDGFVSLEVNPHLAHDTEATIEEARRLWEALSRPNVYIKVPATLAGLPAIRKLTAEGINVNVTLLFGLPRYRQVAEAYVAGLRDRVAAGNPVDKLSSVASFFLSRIDVLVDPMLKEKSRAGGKDAETARRLRGEVAIACAKKAYQMYKEMVGSEDFAGPASRNATPQRVLWASTSTKNPDYPDTKYVEPLIGAETINTMPLETLEAYRDHGNPESRLEQDLEEAERVLSDLAAIGIDIDRVTQQLEDEAVEKFNKPYDKLMSTLEEKVRSLQGGAGIAGRKPTHELRPGH